MDEMVLEPLELSNDMDVRFVYEVRRNPEVAKFLFGDPPDSLEAHKAWLETNVPEKRLMFVAKVSSGVLTWCVGYFHAIPGDEVEVGFAVHPDMQGNGYGGFMVDALVAWLAVHLPGKKVILRVKTDNRRAVSLYERNGFVRREVYMNGQGEKAVYEWRGS